MAKFTGSRLSIHAIALACVVIPIAIVFAVIKAGEEYFRSNLLMTPLEGNFLMALVGAALGLGVMVAFRAQQSHWSWWVVALTVGAAVEMSAFAGRARFGLALLIPFFVIFSYYLWMAWAAVRMVAASKEGPEVKPQLPVPSGMKKLLFWSVLTLDILLVLKMNGWLGQPWNYNWKFAPVIPLLVAVSSMYLAMVGKGVIKS